MRHDRVDRFLQAPVPPFPSSEALVWKNEAKRLGRESWIYLVGVLDDGKPGEQYAALLCLRALGDEAWVEGYGENMTYHVKHNSTQVLISPTVRKNTLGNM